MIPKTAQFYIDEIEKVKKKHPINDAGFLASIKVQVRANRMLTEKQSKYLVDIHQRVTESPLIRR